MEPPALLATRITVDEVTRALTVHSGLTTLQIHVALTPVKQPPAWTADWQLGSEEATAVANTATIGIQLRWRPVRDGIELTVQLTNDSSTTVALEQCDVAVTGLSQWWDARSVKPMGLRVAYCGAHSRSPTSRSYVTSLDGQAELESWWVGAISGGAGPGIVLGGSTPTRFVTRVRERRDAVIAEVPLEQWVLSPGESVTLDPLWLALCGTAPFEALEQFADVLGASQGARISSPPSGWGSWGHWLERIDAGLMREMVHAVDGSAALRKVVDIVQIDDGWSELLDTHRVSASWRPNQRFPSGLAPLAQEIARTGRRCGLWILPFAVNAGSSLVETDPAWLVQGADGAPLLVGGSAAYCLDPTHPRAAAWLSALLERFADSGIDYLKLDFLRVLLAPDPAFETDAFREPRRYHGARTRLEAYRAGLAVIRAAVGNEATLVAGSAPAGAGVGLIDVHRVGPDIERAWTGRLAGVRDAARAIAANWFWHGRTWVNDPDYLLACESEALTRFWATVVALSGGSVILSADLSTLAPWAETALAFVMPPVGRAARPLDLFASGPEPRRWVLPFERGGERWTMLGVLNWGDRPLTERIAPAELGLAGPLHVWDAWRQRHSIAVDQITAPIEAQSAALLRLTAVTDVPAVIGTDIHWAQGWVEIGTVTFDTVGGRLRIIPSATLPRAGRVWIWVPDGWTPVSGTEAPVDNLFAVALDGAAELVIDFSRTTTTAPPARIARAS